MNHPDNQDREWELVQAIRRLRESGTGGTQLASMEQELVAAYQSDIAKTAKDVRGKYRNYRLYNQDPPEHGDLENRLKLWLLNSAVAAYDPLRNTSFAKFVFNGWWKGGCIQEYVKQFKLPKSSELDHDGERKRDANGKVLKKHEMLLDLEGMVSQGGPSGLELLAVLAPLLLRRCRREELERRQYRGECTCPGCTADEFLRREAMLVLLRSDFSWPDCSDEFQRRRWWNSLADGPE